MRHVRMCLFMGLLALLLLGSPAGAAAAPSLPTPAGWPLDGTPPLERGFDPPAKRWGAGHRGVDLGGAVGDAVRSAAAGTVTFAGPLAGRGVVVVDHGDVRTTYEPVAATVTPGTVVHLGSALGRLQGGGHCPTTACLHWGLLHGEDYLDPLSLITAAPVGESGPIRLLPHSARDRAREQAAARKALAAAGAATGQVAPFAGVIGNGLLHPVTGGITSPFGMRFHPVLHVWKLHDGLDFGAACGTPIRAPAAGVVTAAYFNAGYGNRLMVDHGTLDAAGAAGGHRIVTGFNHATHYVVPVGAQVRAGQILGYVGSTGYSTGCHLHLMVWRDGALTNPAELF